MAFQYRPVNPMLDQPQGFRPVSGGLANPTSVSPSAVQASVRDRVMQTRDRFRALRPPTPTPTPTPTPAPIPQMQFGENDMRGDIYTPGGDQRLQGAQNATDQAASNITSGPNYSQMAQQNMQRYRGLFGSGQVQGQQLNPNVQGRQVNTQVGFQGVNPNAQFRGVNTNVQGGPSVAARESGRYLNEQDQALSSLGGPNRTELARQALADFDQANEEGLRERYRTVGQRAAQFGRLGMGDTGRQAIDVGRQFEQDRMRYANELARSVAEGDISDRFRRVDVTSGLRRGESGIESGLRGEERGERDYFTGLGERNVGRAMDERDAGLFAEERNIGRQIGERNTAMGLGERNVGRAFADREYGTGLDERNFGRAQDERNFGVGLDERNQARDFERMLQSANLGGRDAGVDLNDRYDRFGAAGSLEDRIFDQGISNRNEYRGERGYQTGRAQQDLENRIRQRELENAEFEQRLRQSIAQSMYGRG